MHGVGNRVRNPVVVPGTNDAVAPRLSRAPGLVGGCGQRDVWLAGGAHPLWANTRRELRDHRPGLGAVVHSVRPVESRTPRTGIAGAAVPRMGRDRRICRRPGFKPDHAKNRGADEGGGAGYKFQQLAWLAGTPAGKHGNRDYVWVAVSQ